MKKTAVFLIVILLLLQITAMAHWADPYFKELQEKQIIIGDEGGFRADDPLLRCEFSAMLNRAFSFSEEIVPVMEDVYRSDWYYQDFYNLCSAGIVTGDENGYISPMETMTRAEMAVMLARALDLPSDYAQSDHEQDIPSWAFSAVNALREKGVCTGYADGTFGGNRFLLRSEAAAALSKALALNDFSAGDGSLENPYCITQPKQLQLINQDLDAAYIIEADLDFTDIELPVIGTENNPFNGVLIGNGHKLIVRKSAEGSNILFRKIGESGQVKGVRLICPSDRFSLASVNEGCISYCSNTSWTGEIQDYVRKFGGIAQINRGQIDRCYNGSKVQRKEVGYTVGGIAGENSGKIQNCFNFGSVQQQCGGIAGANTGVIENCFTTNGNVSATDKGQLVNTYAGQDVAAQFSAPAFCVENGHVVLSGFPFYGNEDYVLYNGGDGSAANPYLIMNAEHFQNIEKNPGGYFKQTANISGVQQISTFSGVYDGNGFFIQAVRIMREDNEKAALFDRNDGTLMNIHIVDAIVQSLGVSAGIAADNYGIIQNCSFDGLVTGENAAGVCYTNHRGGVVEQSFSVGQVLASKEAAGICIFNNGILKDVYTVSEVQGTLAGGLVKDNRGEIRCAYFAGTIKDNFSGVAVYNYGLLWGVYACAQQAVLQDYGQSMGVAVRDKTQMLFESAYPSLDFVQIWEMGSESSYAYPTLKNNPHVVIEKPQNTTQFSGGNGTVTDPYRIVTPMQLANISLYPDANFILMNDLDLGNLMVQTPDFIVSESFSGILNGNGKTIKGYTAAGNRQALFTENSGLIQDLYIAGSLIQGNQCAGLVIKNNGTIQNCAFSGEIDGDGAGICYENSGSVLRCCTDGKIVGNVAAGIAIENKGTIQDCYSTARLEAESVWGIAGGAEGSTENSWFGGYILADRWLPIADGNHTNCFYLNFYGDDTEEAKTTENIQSVSFSDTAPWTLNGTFPVLADMPVMILPHFTMEGTGSQRNPFIILEKEQLKFLGMYTDRYFRLDRNLYFEQELFHAIDSFSGGLDGNDRKINGVRISGINSGLFKTLTGNVQNLTMEKCTIEGVEAVGSIAAINEGVIKNCVTIGGRVGTSGTIAGGITGYNKNNAVVSGCANGSDIFSAAFSGGIAGQNDGVVTMSNNTGGVIATAEALNSSAGGIVGANNNSVNQCYNNGKILSYSESGKAFSGGIAGLGGGKIRDCYNTGEMNAKAKEYAYCGGICGYAEKQVDIQNAYNTGFGNATASTVIVGSALGYAPIGQLRNFVYEHTLPPAVGQGNVRVTAVTAQAADVMMRKEGFAGFDFDTVWEFVYEGDYYYPQLTANPQAPNVRAENMIDFAGGDGSLENPYKIITPEQLNNVRNYLGSTFMLLGDIDMTQYCKTHDFLPIGDNVFSFFGLFVGNNYCISGLSFVGDDFGLFRENHGEIYNCFFKGAEGSGSGGTVAAYNTGLIYNCMNLEDMEEQSRALNVNRGGLVGINKGTGMIISCYNVGDLNISGENVQTAGIAYGNYGIISGSFNAGSVSAAASQLSVAGGIAAYNFGVISDCYTSNQITAQSEAQTDSFAGGIAGTNGSIIVNCYYSADTDPTARISGNISATNNGSLTNCYYIGKQGYAYGFGTVNNVRACTQEELMNPNTFEGFDFENMWIMDASFQYKYPQFIEIAHREKK